MDKLTEQQKEYLMRAGKLAVMVSSIKGASLIYKMVEGRIIAEFEFTPIKD